MARETSVKPISVVIPVPTLDGLEKLRRRRYCTRTALIREALAEFIRQQTYKLDAQDAEMRAHFSKEAEAKVKVEV